jgi:pSer/pThr/pTyr-binding forkhead associated (FHA) protein
MPTRLIACRGGSEILIDRTLLVIGRHPHCDSRLVSPRVSRWHCCVIAVAGEVCVRDLGSTNGTWINGQRVTSGRIRCGDVLSIAHIRYRIEEGQADRAHTADAPDRLDDQIISLADTHGTALCDECGGG